MVIELRGDVDAVVLLRLAVHVKDVLAARTRFVIVDAFAVTRCDPGLLDLLGRTQQRLARQDGLLTVRGLRPDLRDGIGRAAGAAPAPSSVVPVSPEPRSSSMVAGSTAETA